MFEWDVARTGRAPGFAEGVEAQGNLQDLLEFFVEGTGGELELAQLAHDQATIVYRSILSSSLHARIESDRSPQRGVDEGVDGGVPPGKYTHRPYERGGPNALTHEAIGTARDAPRYDLLLKSRLSRPKIPLDIPELSLSHEQFYLDAPEGSGKF